MKYLRVFALVAFLMGSLSASAQSDFHSALTVKALFADYHTLNKGDVFDFQDWSAGYELGYIGYLNDKWSVNLPVTVTEVQLPEALRSQRFIGVHGQIQHHFIGRTRKVNPYVAAGFGIVLENEDENHLVIPASIGARVVVGPATDLVGEVSYRHSLDDDRHNLHVGLGLIQHFGVKDMTMGKKETPEAKDTDGDGLADDIDLCPEIAGLEAYFGCPDTDEDGVPDHLDDCPDVAGIAALGGCPDRDGDGVPDHKDDCPDVKGVSENNGCPPAVADRDGDGIPDSEDNCPDERGTLNNKGCPEVVKSNDRDNDGVADNVDRCPDQAGPVSLSGCPDRDGDGVADIDDECPDQPGSRNAAGCPDTDGDGVPDKDDRCINTPGPASNKGCPSLDEADRATLEFAVQAVEFDFGKATLRPESFSILNKIADILKRYPKYDLRISGHTDNVGDANRNLQLSERRARSCYEYLSTRGISVSRMSYVGLGEERPIASNDTDAGRSSNRRVEFDVYVK